MGWLEVIAMGRRRPVLTLLLIVACGLPVRAQSDRGPELTGFILNPSHADTCTPVRLSFTITNRGTVLILSQSPYSGFTYPLYSTHTGMGFRAIAGRYTVGVSLDGGRDGYPFRWGFPGSLPAGRSVIVSGLLAIPETGNFMFAPALLRGDEVVSRLSVPDAVAVVHPCMPPPPTREGRVVFPPVYPVYPPVPRRSPFQPTFPRSPFPPPICGPACYPTFVPFYIDGRLLVPAVPFVFEFRATVAIIGDLIIIRRRGIELVLVANAPYAVLNGRYIPVPSISTFYGGMPYIPPLFVAPIFGASAFHDPYTGSIRIRGPVFW